MKKQTTILVDEELLKKIDKLARKLERSRNWMIQFLLRKGLEALGEEE